MLTLEQPTNSDFSFLNDVAIYLDAEGLPEILIASRYDIPASIGNELVLDVSGEDMQEYIKKDQIDLRLYTVTDEIITADHHILMDATFFVDAEILGQ